MAVKQRIQKLLQELNTGIYEKEEVMALSLLSAVAGESIFLLGAPGVAKSLIARRLKYAFEGGKAFEYLMSRFSTPDEIFGPVAISKLKNEDKYERVVENYLPSADVVFLDEIWKAGPSIQNALLTVINEKKYRNGAQEIDIPMKALISASNELPAKNEGLEALWDRFLVRLEVEGIKEKSNFDLMISEKLDFYNDTVSADVKITNDEFKEWSKAIDEIEIPGNILNVINVIRMKIQQHNKKESNKNNPIYISDRRWRKIVRLLRTSAFLNDRKTVDLMDCFLIKDCLWNEDTQIETVKQIVYFSIEKNGYKFQFDFKSLKDELDELKEDIKSETNIIRPVKYTKIKEYTIQGKNYYRALMQGDFSFDVDDLLEKNIVENLTQSNDFIETKRWRNDLGDKDSVWIKKSNDKYKIFLKNYDNYDTGKEYSFECVDENKEKIFTRKPRPSAERDWDENIVKYLVATTQQKEKLEQYRKKDLEYLRTNIFVNPVLANIVETHLTTTQKEIEIYEVEIRNIQNGYKKLKDKEIVVD